MSLSNQEIQKPIESFTGKIICGDSLTVLKTIPDESVDCVVTSPPYWALRDYGVKGQIGLEPDFNQYLEKLLSVFDEIKRVLKPSGTCWVNLGDTYGGSGSGAVILKAHKSLASKFSASEKRYTKSLLQIPSRFAVAMIEGGWLLRNEIIWHKPNAIPQSIKDRFSVDFEKIFFFVKDRKYYFRQQFEPLKNPKELMRRFTNPFETHKYWQFDRKHHKNLEAIKESQKEILKKGRNKRCVWTIATGALNANHFAVYPAKLIETPILAGCPKGGIVLDPFIGSGTTAVVAQKLGRRFIGIELKSEYVRLARGRLKNIKTNKHSFQT